MASTNFQEDLNWLLIRASMTAKQRIMKLAESYNLTIMQAFTLCLLEPNKPVPMSSISGLLTCDPSNVTGIVERLQSESYIERRESVADRRVKTIELTKSGLKLREKLLDKITEKDAPNLARLSTEETAELKALLQKTLPPANK